MSSNVLQGGAMKTIITVLMATLLLVGCATSTQPDAAGNNENIERNFGATSLTVTTTSIAREVLQSVPPESAMERFEVLDQRGRIISYVAFTDTAFGGLVFVDQKLVGTVSKQDARAFYSCRGYSTAAQSHWAKDASAWTDSLLAGVTPATSVQLDFSGLSSMQSIKGVVGNPLVNQVKSLFDMGSNPFNILKTLYSTRDDMKERDAFKKTLEALSALSPGADESHVAAIIRPEDVSFVTDGLVMAYPKFSVEFYLSGGIVKVIQQPSFYQLSRTQAALFYAPNAQWALCTPKTWREALPKIKPDAKVEVKSDAKQGGQ
jgi:hypothetical protein